MSSTNRGKQREVSDYYITPRWAILDFLNAFACQVDFKPARILDPCAGGDKKNGMAYPDALKQWGHWSLDGLQTCDIREDSRAETKCDYLSHKLDSEPDLIITNPPFSLATHIVSKALSDVRQGGYVVILQRVNFFGGDCRRDFFSQAGLPIFTFVHRKRMAFMPKGAVNPRTGKKYGQDSIEYAHLVWQRGVCPIYSKLQII